MSKEQMKRGVPGQMAVARFQMAQKNARELAQVAPTLPDFNPQFQIQMRN